MADTPNHNYNVPDQGDQDWHQPLNENFEEFEVARNFAPSVGV